MMLVTAQGSPSSSENACEYVNAVDDMLSYVRGNGFGRIKMLVVRVPCFFMLSGGGICLLQVAGVVYTGRV
jgi:hypothetical protein